MKVAVVVLEDEAQLVLTPETEWEERTVKGIFPQRRGMYGVEEAAPFTATVYRGTFYDCQGGWIRTGDNPRDSIMLRFNTKDSE